MGEKTYLVNKIEFFTSGLQEGDIDHHIPNIKNRVNQWLTDNEENIGEINKMYMSMSDAYPIFWIWYSDTT